MKRQPHIETWFMKQQPKEVNKKPKPENSKNKRAKTRKKGLTKQQPKTSKTWENSGFERWRFSLWSKPIYGPKKHQCAQLVFLVLVLFVQDLVIVA